jgi:hypothetical protein
MVQDLLADRFKLILRKAIKLGVNATFSDTMRKSVWRK